MVPIIFFGLLCLGPWVVVGQNRSWIPATIPWPAQQCRDINPQYVGECVIQPEVSRVAPFYFDSSPCSSLKCANPRIGGTYAIVRHGRPKDGTVCGLLKVCRAGYCIDIEPHEIPIQTGIKTTFFCIPTVLPKPTVRRKAKVKTPSRKM